MLHGEREEDGIENERARARDVILRSQFIIRVERGNKAEGEDDRGYIGWMGRYYDGARSLISQSLDWRWCKHNTVHPGCQVHCFVKQKFTLQAGSNHIYYLNAPPKVGLISVVLTSGIICQPTHYYMYIKKCLKVAK